MNNPLGRHVVIGAGPVGRAVVAALGTRGITPTVVTRSGTSVPGANAYPADVRDPGAMREALAFAEVVFQCSQPAYHRWPQEFPDLQAAIVEATARAGALLVVVENLYGYGVVDGPLHEGLPLTATTRRGAVRAQLWQTLESAHRRGDLRVEAGRASDFFGPGEVVSNVGSQFVASLIAGKTTPVMGDPDRRHTATFVPDFGEALVRLSETPAAWGQAWHVPNAPTVTTRQLAQLLAETAGRPEPVRLRPYAPWQLQLAGIVVPPIRGVLEMSYQFESDFVVDHSRYAALIGDHATPLDQAVAQVVHEHARQGVLAR